MIQRRTFLRCFSAACIGSALAPLKFARASRVVIPEEQLGDLLAGVWRLQSYTYTSNNATFSSPDEMEGEVRFGDGRYEANFTTHISAVGISRTRDKSESGTYSVDGNRIRLFAEEASEDEEMGEEFLTAVEIDGNAMTLTSNNGSNNEVWQKVS